MTISNINLWVGRIRLNEIFVNFLTKSLIPPIEIPTCSSESSIIKLEKKDLVKWIQDKRDLGVKKSLYDIKFYDSYVLKTILARKHK